MTKYCEDCRFCSTPPGTDVLYSICLHPNSKRNETTEHLISRKLSAEGALYASTMRRHRCGPEAKLFEPKLEVVSTSGLTLSTRSEEAARAELAAKREGRPIL